MFRGDWSKRFTPKLLTGALIWSLVAMIGFGAITRGILEQAEYEGRSNERRAEYSTDTYSPAYDACVRLAIGLQADCVAKANGEWRENERKEQDLIAQQTSAIWTFLMGCAAIIGMALSALGVWLVYTTFDETRNANEIAKDTARKQLRPFVYVTKVVFDFVYNGQRGDSEFTFDIHIKNFGQTPAKKVVLKIYSFVKIYDDSDFAKDLRNAEISEMNDLAPGFENWRQDHALTISYDEWQSINARTSCIYVDGVIEYSDAFSQKFTTEFRRIAVGKIRHPTKALLDAYHGNEAT